MRVKLIKDSMDRRRLATRRETESLARNLELALAVVRDALSEKQFGPAQLLDVSNAMMAFDPAMSRAARELAVELSEFEASEILEPPPCPECNGDRWVSDGFKEAVDLCPVCNHGGEK